MPRRWLIWPGYSRAPERDRFVTALPTPGQQALQAWVAHRRPLVAMDVAEHQRLSWSHAAARMNIEALLNAMARTGLSWNEALDAGWVLESKDSRSRFHAAALW